MPSSILICDIRTTNRLGVLLGRLIDSAKEHDSAVGLDVERSLTTQQTAVLQLATCDMVLVVLVPPRHKVGYMAKDHPLVQFFDDRTVVKAGFATEGDSASLRDIGCRADDLLDLQTGLNQQGVALCRVVAQALAYNMSSGFPTMPYGHPLFSSWHARPLCSCQIDYACRDAVACFLLYQRFREQLLPTIDATTS